MNPPGPVTETLALEGQLLRLTLNAPRGNILHTPMIEALLAALERPATRRLKAIVFDGAGEHFSFGASVEEHTKERVAGMLTTFHSLFRRLLALGVPTIAAVRGQCKGGGLELAAFCTWLFAAPDAVFGQPEIKLAVFPPMASVLLPWRLGGGAGMDLCVSGRSVSAEEALKMRLVHAISPDPVQAALDFAVEHLTPSSASSLRFAERAARHGLRRLLDEDLPALERLYVAELMETPDASEGINAFIARRKPSFGREVD